MKYLEVGFGRIVCCGLPCVLPFLGQQKFGCLWFRLSKTMKSLLVFFSADASIVKRDEVEMKEFRRHRKKSWQESKSGPSVVEKHGSKLEIFWLSNKNQYSNHVVSFPILLTLT